MTVYPKIQSACPFRGRLSELMDGDVCRACGRQVHDLSALSDSDRRAFLASCADEVCISYRFPLRAAIAATMTVAVLGAALPAAAQDRSVEEEVIIVGGIKDPANVQYVEDPRDEAVPELPVVYEETAGSDTAENSSVAAAGADLGQTVDTH